MKKLLLALPLAGVLVACGDPAPTEKQIEEAIAEQVVRLGNKVKEISVTPN